MAGHARDRRPTGTTDHWLRTRAAPRAINQQTRIPRAAVRLRKQRRSSHAGASMLMRAPTTCGWTGTCTEQSATPVESIRFVTVDYPAMRCCCALESQPRAACDQCLWFVLKAERRSVRHRWAWREIAADPFLVGSAHSVPVGTAELVRSAACSYVLRDENLHTQARAEVWLILLAAVLTRPWLGGVCLLKAVCY